MSFLSKFFFTYLNICNCRIDTEDTVQQKRNWYQQINAINYHKNKQMSIQLPKSKWDSEDEEISSISITKEEIEEVNKLPVTDVSVSQRKSFLTIKIMYIIDVKISEIIMIHLLF